VNFTHVWLAAKTRGWDLLGFADQAQFLTGIAAGLPDPEQFPASLRRQFHTLVHPGFMGRRFRVLALARGVPTELRLDGFRFGRISGL
jgi:SAM-dependent MidA family methyltransferase